MTDFPQLPATLLFARGIAVQAELSLVLLLTIAAVLSALALGGLIRAQKRVRGTTLTALLIWAAISLVALIVVESWSLRDVASTTVKEKFDFLAAVSTFCPLVALLGAKRPQNRAWQLIVLSFWGVAALPALQSLVIHPTDPLIIHGIWRLFFAILILTGAANYLPTRFAGPSVIVAVGQCALLANDLPLASIWLVPIKAAALRVLPELASGGRSFGERIWIIAFGVAPIVVAICWANFIARRQSRRLLFSFGGWNCVWFNFRNSFGCLWAMRIVERLNVLSFGSKSQVQLSWRGFHVSAAANAGRPQETNVSEVCASTWSDDIGPLEADFRSLLVRFVSNQWIDERLRNPGEKP